MAKARYYPELSPTAVVGGKSLYNPAKRRLAMKKTELKLTLTVNGRTLSKSEKKTILTKLKKVLTTELGGHAAVQGQEPLVTVCCTGCTACTCCTACKGARRPKPEDDE